MLTKLFGDVEASSALTSIAEPKTKPSLLAYTSNAWITYFSRESAQRLLPLLRRHKKKNPEGQLAFRARIGGGYLLFHFRSIIGVVRFNFSVRNGKRWSPHAMATLVSLQHLAMPYKVKKECRKQRRSAVHSSFYLKTANKLAPVLSLKSAGCAASSLPPSRRACALERVWVISIARLVRYRTYTCDLSTSSSLTTLIWRSYLEGGFVLRCFQHLSWPDAATRRCSWRNNRLTGGLSDTVLSY